MIQLREIIHYYIGQKVLVDDKKIGTLIGGDYVPNEIGQIYHQIILDGDPDSLMPYNDDPEIPPLRVKPLLRPLESITDLEAKELHDKLIPGWGQEYPERWHQQEMMSWITAGMRPTLGPQSVFDATHYLLSKGYDLFSLIESGQALDISTLNKTE